MADPISFATGLGAGLITEHLAGVVRKLYTELQHIQKCQNECASFKHQLDSLSGFLKEIEPAIVLQLPNSDFVKAWWSDLKKCLDESLYLVSSFRPDTKCNLRNFFFKNSLRKGILAKRDELERLLRDAKINKGLLIINVNETKQLASDVSKVKGDVEKMNQILSEIGESTKMYLQSEGDRQAIASKLSTFKSFSRNEEISKHVVHDESFFLQQEEEPLFGREKLIKELEVQLLNPQGPKVIAFHGMGGAGKTRLVKALINRPKVQSYFGKAQNLFWVSVGRDSKMLDLQAKVEKHISSSSEDKPREDKPESQIRRLIVLDDLWKKEEFRFAQRKSESSEFRFLITTRQQKMVDEYNNVYPVLVPILSETDSWNLFIYHAFSFRSADYILSLDDMAKQVAQRCKGLPLALKVIGRAMSDKMTVREWNEALCSLKNHITIDNDHDMDLMQVLRISYDALESIEKYVGQVRKCFLYFGAFKEDAYIDVQSLMNCWVGEGLLKAHRNPVSQTYIVLGVLIGSSLVEKVPDDRCQIHDMLRELTFYITKQERPHENLFQATNNQQLDRLDYARILRISWFDAKLFAAVKIQAPKLKVLLLDGSSVSEVFLNSCFANLCSLEVLSLKETNIEYLPESLGKLQRLVVLSLCQSHIRSLPYSLRMLRQLKILDLSDCSYLQELPKDAFLDLKNLQVFKLRCSWKTSPVLRPCFLHKETIGKERTFAKHFSDEDAAEFRYLTGLTLFDFCGTTTELPAFMENMSQLTVLHISCPIRDLEPLKALNTLEDLKVLHSDLTELPDWISELSFLTKLRISTTNRMATYFLICTLFAAFAGSR